MANRLHDGRNYREFGLTSFAIDHFTSILVLTFIIVLMGLISYATVPKEATPEIVIPNIFVSTVYPGVAPRDIETLVTRPIEEEVSSISEVKIISSVSGEGYSSINVEFVAGTDMNDALQKVRERVDIAKPKLPSAVEEPRVIEIDISEFPIMQVNVAGNYDLVRLREVAEDIQDELEQISSILEVTLAGGLEREVQVDVDLAKLKFYDISYDDVNNAIRAENVTIPGGSIEVGAMKYLVRVPGEFGDTAPIADVVVKIRQDQPIYVKDVARVDFGFKAQETYARLDGNPVVTLGVKKRSGENIIETAAAVKAAIARMTPILPPGTIIKITSDQSEDIKSMVNNLENNIISGLLLVIGVLLFFMGVRNASFVGIAIPFSMLLSFTIMQLVGITLNMVVLFSLILALGMLVDNAIVVVENIYRFREQGFDKIEAAKLGTGEVAMPIIASTATTLAAFLPMAFWPDVVGEFMKYLPYTLIITLSSSLFIGLIIIPALASRWLRLEGVARTPLTKAMKAVIVVGVLLIILKGMTVNQMATVLLTGTAGLLYLVNRYLLHPIGHWFMTHGFQTILRAYETTLRWALHHRLLMMFVALATMVSAVVAFGKYSQGIEFFPENIPPSNAYIQVEAPLGTNVNQTDKIVNRIESNLKTLSGYDEFESTVSTVGASTSAGFGGGQGTNLATVAVHFLDYKDRTYDTFNTVDDMKNMLEMSVAGGEFAVDKPDMGPPTGKAVNLEISGESPARLKELGDEVVGILERSSIFVKLDGLESDMSNARPELDIQVDREKAALWGLNTRDVGTTVRNAINGSEASKYRDGEDEYDIIVRLAPEYREDLNTIGDLTIMNEDGQQIPISSVATWQVAEGSGDINRKDLERVVTVSSAVRPGYNANAVLAEVRHELEEYSASLPSGYQLRYTGQQEDQQKSQDFLSRAFLMALMLTALILISQFDSVFKPAIIVSSIVLSIIGVLVQLIVFKMPFGIVMTGVGVISLAGVVVNNAIVMIAYIETLRHRDDMELFESVVLAGKTRFRPVILTAITTVLGMLPLAVGLNLDFYGFFTALAPDLYWGGEQAAMWGPMALAVIFGLTFATFLTLVLVPVMVSLLDSFDAFLNKYFVQHESVTPVNVPAEG
jgi:multidrug efflux pump subunit AcrB